MTVTPAVWPVHCLECGLEVAGADGEVADKGVPALAPGDFTVCIACGHVMAIAEDGGLRRLDEREANSISELDRVMLFKNARFILERRNRQLSARERLSAAAKKDDQPKET